MTLLYVFPHPDDESFGPAPAMARQSREGHAVHLLTLTKGGATKQRHRLGLSVQEMGEVRARETGCAAETLGADLTILDFPDGGLAEMDPREIEVAVRRQIREVRPDVVVTYNVFGNSGHPDHLVTHSVVKRVVCTMWDEGLAPRRLALFSLVDGEMEGAEDHLRGMPPEKIGARVMFEPEDMETARRALACYETYAPVIAEHDPLSLVAHGVAFELFDESPAVPLADLTSGLG